MRAVKDGGNGKNLELLKTLECGARSELDESELRILGFTACQEGMEGIGAPFQIGDDIKGCSFCIEALHRKRTEESYTDHRTGLKNERFLQRTFDKYRKEGKKFAILQIDLKKFKSVNDKRGQDVGDETIELFADCMRANLRDTDIPIFIPKTKRKNNNSEAFRTGGDEFVIFVEVPENDNEGNKKQTENTSEEKRAPLQESDVNNGMQALGERLKSVFESTDFVTDFNEGEMNEDEKLGMLFGFSVDDGVSSLKEMKRESNPKPLQPLL